MKIKFPLKATAKKAVGLPTLLMMCTPAAWAQTVVTTDSSTAPDSLQTSATAAADSTFSSLQLDDVVVTSQRQLVKNEADKLTYDVQGDSDSKTRNVMEMLRKVPMVTVDGQENIKVKGSSTFKIYKNGHPDASMSSNPKEVLKSIPASMVKKIEVITEPGAKYDAEGTTAILNIVMVDGSRFGGVTGTISTQATTLGTLGGNGFVTTQLGKFILSVNYGLTHMSHRQTENRQETLTTYKDSGNALQTSSLHHNPGYIHYGQVEGSYELDSLNLLTLSFGGYRYDVDVSGDGSQTMTSATGTTLYSYNDHFTMPSYSYQDWNGRFDYQHKTRREDEVLTLSYMLSTTNRRDDERHEFAELRNVPFAYSGYEKQSHERFFEHTVQGDWVRPLCKHHKIETGLKYIHRLNKSHTAMSYLPLEETGAGENESASRAEPFRHTTQVGAAYAQYLLSSGAWSARAGLRYEWSRLEAESERSEAGSDGFHRTLSDWVPSASVNWQMSNANSLKLSYSTSISRPGIHFLNPAVIETPSSKTFGNASLSSSRSTSVSMVYMHIGPKLTYNVNPYTVIANNWIGSVNYSEGDKDVTTYGNVVDFRTFGLATYVQWQPLAQTTLVLNGAVKHERQENTNIGLKMAKWNGDYYLQLTQRLPGKVILTAGGGGLAGRNVESVYGYSSSYHWYYLSLQRSFLKDDRLTLRLWAQNLFDGNHNHWHSYTTQGYYTGWTHSTNRARAVGLNLSWRFGKLSASVKKTATTIENSDVVGGIKKGE